MSPKLWLIHVLKILTLNRCQRNPPGLVPPCNLNKKINILKFVYSERTQLERSSALGTSRIFSMRTLALHFYRSHHLIK